MNRVKLIFLPVLLIIMSTQFSRANLLLVDETVNVSRESIWNDQIKYLS